MGALARGFEVRDQGLAKPVRSRRLRASVKTIAEKAAADYAALTHEAPRTIEHVASVNAWDGQHEASSLEVLGPEHERAFIDAACDALGVLLIRPYVGEPEFARFWKDYESVIEALPR